MKDKAYQQGVDSPANSLPTISKSLEKAPQEEKQPFLSSFLQTGQDVVTKTIEARKATTKQIQKLIEQVTQRTGRLANSLSEIWLIRKLGGVLNLNWLFGAVDNVNLEKAENAVKKLKQQHPKESPSQLAHRIMVEKATQAGGIGLATSILPGAATALLLVDLATTTQLQSEMVYQIASVYGLDLKDPARKGEVLGIFSLAFGGGRLLRATGIGLLRNIPFAGAVIDASSNAAMIYSLGYAACRFYEAKLDESKSLTSEQTLSQLKQQSENYLQRAIAQEAVMDQILTHMILVSNPHKAWKDILPELQALNLSSNSLKAIEQNIKSPQPLDTLLNQLNRDFAIPLLAQCYRIAQFNSEVTPDEQKVLDMITAKFDIDLNSIQSAVNRRDPNFA